VGNASTIHSGTKLVKDLHVLIANVKYRPITILIKQYAFAVL